MRQNLVEKKQLSELLSACEKKFGSFDYDADRAIYSNGCQQCTGGCNGHGISVWTACDVK